jgi:uncharacterized protein (TIGR00369 family)
MIGVIIGTSPARRCAMTDDLMTAIDQLPFHRHLGITTVAIGQGWAKVSLPGDAAFISRTGSVQGGAIYSAAEAAASAALAGLMRDEVQDANIIVAGSSMSFVRPALGSLTARAELSETPERIYRRLSRDGATALAVVVTVTDGDGRDVAHVEFEFRVCRQLSVVKSSQRLVAVA